MVSRVKVYIGLKEGVVDREGEAIQKGLKGLGYAEIEGLKVGKVIEFQIDKEGARAIEETVKVICDRYLVNQVLEEYEYQIEIEEN